MNNPSFEELKNYIEELERSSIKLVIDGINVYIIDMKYLPNGQLDLKYICFDKKSDEYNFDEKVHSEVQKFITNQLKEQQGQKWYKILFSKICALIKNIRKRFGLS